MFLISCFPNDRIKVKWSRPKWFYVTPAHSSQNFIFNTSNLICVQLFQAHMESNWFHCWIEVKVIANNIPSSYLNSKTKQNCDAHQTLDVQYILFCRSNIVQCTKHRNIVHSQSLHHSVGTIVFFLFNIHTHAQRCQRKQLENCANQKMFATGSYFENWPCSACSNASNLQNSRLIDSSMIMITDLLCILYA